MTDDLFARLGIAAEMARLERYIGGLVTSPVLGLSQSARHILTAGGKRLRAALAFLAARLDGGPIPETAIYAAAAVEIIHAASLVHDDLIDQSPHRRGRPTIHEKWHHDVALLAGDYLFALAARAVTLTASVAVMDHISAAAAAVCEGELTSVDEIEPLADVLEAYNFKIAHKTAALFAAAGHVGAVCGGADTATVAALGRFGHALGMAFQIVDDILDYTSDEATLGKPVGGDLRQGIVTLPFFYFLQSHPQPEQVIARLEQPMISGGANGSGGEDPVGQIVAQVRASEALRRAAAEATEFSARAKTALVAFPDSVYRRALLELADFVVERHI